MTEPPSVLTRLDPSSCLVVIPCSARKRAGGRPGSLLPVGDDLAAARHEVLGRPEVALDEIGLLPAWERYDGGLYRAAGRAIRTLAGDGRLAILSGGYGVLDGQDLIGTYDKMMRRSDWPPGLLEQTLADRAAAAGLDVLAFAASTTDYAKVIRRTPWRLPQGRSAHLLSIQCLRGVAAVSSALGGAVRAFAAGSPYPAGTVVERLAP